MQETDIFREKDFFFSFFLTTDNMIQTEDVSEIYILKIFIHIFFGKFLVQKFFCQISC